MHAATIDVIAGQAIPSVGFNMGMGSGSAVCNLTRGFNQNPSLFSFAFDFIGSVKIEGSPSGLRFGFIQFIRHEFLGFFYAGQRDREGSIAILLHPVVSTDYMIDTASATLLPFYMPDNSSIFNSELTCQMGDHPVFSMEQRRLNFTTGAENFLYQVVDVRDAWSIFTVQDPTGKFTHLAHVHWLLRYDFTFQWRNKSIAITRNASHFWIEPVAKGAPTEPTLQGLLSSLTTGMTPIANDSVRRALAESLLQNQPNRSDNPAYFATMPKDFFL